MTEEQKGSIGFWVKLGERMAAKLDDYGQDLTEISASLKTFRRGNFRPITETVTIPSSGVGLMSFGIPPAGFAWLVRVANCSDAIQWSNAMPGTAQWGVGELPIETAPSSPVQLGGQTIRWAFPSCPNVANFGTNQFPVGLGENLFVQILGGTSGQLVQATVVVEEWPVTVGLVRSE